MAILGGLSRIARLLVSIDADTRGLESALDSAEARVKSFAARVEKKIDTRAFLAVGAAITGIGVGIGGLLVSTGLFAARVEVLETVMKTVGKTAGYSAEFLAEQEEVIKELGITTKSAREVLILFMQSQLDVADAAKIARVAQDLAVISGQNSSDATVTLTNAIVAQRPELLKQFGIVKTIDKIYLKYGKSLGIVTEKTDKSGKTVRSWARDLTEAEKKQAFLNEILEEGKKVAGVYETAMGDVGKKLTSIPRLIEEAKLAIGEAFIPVIGLAVDKLSELLKMFTDLSPETKTMITHILMFVAGLALIVGPILTLIGLLPTLIAGFAVLLGPVGLVTGAVTALVVTIGVLVWKHWDEIKAKVTEVFAHWDNVMGYVRKFIEDKVIPTIKKLWGKVEKLGGKFVEVGGKICDEFIDILPGLVDTIETTVIPAFENLIEKIGPMIEKGIEFLGLLAEAAIDSIPKVVDKIGELVEWLAKLDPRWLEIILGIIGFAVALKTLSVIMGRVLGFLKPLLPTFKFLWNILKWIASPILLVTTLWGNLVSIAETLYLVFLGISAPVAVVIVAILALIGTILLWVKYGEAARKKTREIWGAIWNFLVNLWVTIGKKAVEIWNSVRDFLVNLWESIKTKAVETWDSVKVFFVELWESIKIKATETWEGIKQFFIDIWEGIKNTFIEKGEEIWAWMLDWIPFLNLIVTEWGPTIIEIFRDIWEKIKVRAFEIWILIKDKVIEIWDLIKEKATEIWNLIKEKVIEIWNSIKEKATEIWNSIKEFLINIFDPIKEKAIEIWESIKEFFAETWESIKSKIIETWDSIKEFFIETWEGIKTKVIEYWDSIIKFFAETWEDVIEKLNTFKENFLKVWDYIKEGLKSPINAMIGLINNLLSRVESVILLF